MTTIRKANPRQFYVRIDRTDGSRTYKGTLTAAAAEREAAAWHTEMPEYGVEVVRAAECRTDFAAWVKATHGGPNRACQDSQGRRYYPQAVAP